MPSGGSLVFSTSAVHLGGEACRLGAFLVSEGEYLCVEVSDTGVGIPEQTLQHIFDPFFTTKEVGKGTGLGLAAVFGTMVSHRGAVTVQSTEGQGTTFRLFLPLSRQLRTAAEEKLEKVQRGSGVVLVVDDEELVRLATSVQLESLGYSVLTAESPVRAVELFERHHSELALALVDMVMPQMSGLEVAGMLRKIDPAVPLVLVSGFPRSSQLDHYMPEPIAGFLQKPFRSGELGRALEGLCVKKVT